MFVLRTGFGRIRFFITEKIKNHSWKPHGGLSSLLLKPVQQGLHCKSITVRTESGYLADACAGDDGIPAESFAGMKVGKVHFYGRETAGNNRISQSDGIVSVAPRIKYDALAQRRSLLQHVDQLAFHVGLTKKKINRWIQSA